MGLKTTNTVADLLCKQVLKRQEQKEITFLEELSECSIVLHYLTLNNPKYVNFSRKLKTFEVVTVILLYCSTVIIPSVSHRPRPRPKSSHLKLSHLKVWVRPNRTVLKSGPNRAAV